MIPRKPCPLLPTRRPPLEFIADGPIEIILGQGQLIVNSTSGCILHIHSARSVVVHQSDFDETNIYGDLDEATPAN